MSCKITLIGAGSVVFAKTLIGDILQKPETAGAHICLMDIDPARLKVAETVTRKMIEALGVPATCTATLDQREAIRNANYVICTIQVGGYKPSTVRDFEIPKKYGLRQTIADTLGVGGVFRALRTIPVIRKIAEDIDTLGAPDCLLLNYTNPMCMNCWAVEEAVGIPHVGLCHSVFGTARQLATFINIPIEEVNYRVAGINHMAFFLQFEHKGQDLYPLLFKLLDDPDFNREKVRFEMMRRTGYFVTESSEHQAEYVPHFIHFGDEQIKKFDVPLDEYPRRCEAIMAHWKQTEKEIIGGKGRISIRPPSHEYGSFIIHSMETGIERVVYGNVPNRGIIENLPQDCNVEVPCLVDRNGLQPVTIGELPSQLAGICETNISVQRLTVEAALTGRREHIYHAVMLDPHTAASLPLDKIWNMCDELIEAHQKDGFLGEFEPTIQGTGRAHAGTADRVIARLEPQTEFETAAGSTCELVLSVENPNPKTARVKLTVEPRGEAIRVKGKRSFSLKVPAGEHLEQTVVLTNASEAERSGYVDLNTDSTDVLAVGTAVSARSRINGSEGAFELELGGFTAVEGSLTHSAKSLSLKLKVHDSDIRRHDGPLWRQPSMIEFFVAPNAKTRPSQFFVAPATNGKDDPAVLKPDGKGAARGIKATQSTTEMFYEVEVQATKKALGLSDGNGTFLFDLIANLGALGDAHSGGRTALNRHMNSAESTAHYSTVEPVG
ncbi:MAG: alpha-glucosidase/alpha-galactosidase [Opitutales bacterium]